MKVEVEYTRREAQDMITEIHSKKFPLPDGMHWECVIESWGNIKLYGHKNETGKFEEPIQLKEVTDVPL